MSASRRALRRWCRDWTQAFFTPLHANATTTPTLNFCGLGAETITKNGQSPVAANDLITSEVAWLIWDGTYWRLKIRRPVLERDSYPPGTGIPEVTGGASWGSTYNASNTIPFNFLNITDTNIIGLWASGSCSGYLKSDGTCSTPSGIPYPSGTGIVRVSSGSSWGTTAELSGDATTSGSNAVTVVKVNGGSVPASKAFVGTNSSSQLVDATGTVCSSSTLGICKVDGTTITAPGSHFRDRSFDEYMGLRFPRRTPASAYALRGATATCTIPANFTTPTTTASCGTNPTSNTVFTLKDGATTYGTVTLSSSCTATLATSGGASKSVTVDDRLQFVARLHRMRPQPTSSSS